jgi:hypothetical protein
MALDNLKNMIGEEIKWIDYNNNKFELVTNTNKISIESKFINISNHPEKNIESRTPVHSLSEDFLFDDNYLCYFDVVKRDEEKYLTCLLNKEQLDLFIKESEIVLHLNSDIYYCKYNSHRKILRSDLYYINSMYSNNIVNNLISELNCGMKNECDNY